ncbi:hypothetical protein [Saccharospirillum mangrovi]|uniref:hypothetical protein n=1 Tax=Saccharospirillum mangrovi TaxID=2161747 RepID=UPI000D38F094|nr:hypothetical protein [Saccharospirillum mangrovi]
MSDDRLRQHLLDDLEALRQSLDRMARSEPALPVVDEVVEKRPASPLNPDNPFLSSDSLSELIRIRNEAEARAAEEQAELNFEESLDAVLTDNLEAAFNRWADEALADYLQLFERDLRRRLRNDFLRLLAEHKSQPRHGSD